MSKFVKELVTDHLKTRLQGVNDLFLISLVGVDAITDSNLRAELRRKNIEVEVVKNSLARRACEGTPLAPAFENTAGMLALVWGSNDVVSLAKELVRITGEKKYAKIEAKGGVVGGAAIGPKEIKAVSKWPSREEQLSILLGQILSPGAMLASQLTSVGGALASQIKQKGEGEGEEAAAATDAAAPDAVATSEAVSAPEAAAATAPEATG
jgi:large subunit ribosomal protein L10